MLTLVETCKPLIRIIIVVIMLCLPCVCGFIILVKSYTRNSKDFTIGERNIKPYFNKRSVQCILLPQNRTDVETSSDNISVLVNTITCLGGLSPHANIVSDAADGRFKYP